MELAGAEWFGGAWVNWELGTREREEELFSFNRVGRCVLFG